jgi:sugar phosphate isomerase/epimerase
MAIQDKLSVQSYCFRNFSDNRQVAGMVKEIGLSGIELFRLHGRFDDPNAKDAVMQAYADSGVSIVSTGVNALSGGKDERRLFEFLKTAGAAHMSVDFALEGLDDALKSAQALAEEFDVKLGIHIHGGNHWCSNSEALEYIFKRAGNRIGLNMDTAWAIDSKEDPVKMAETFKDRLFSLHLKDVVYNKTRTPEDVIVGSGNLDLSALGKVLKDNGFDGEMIVEYEGEAEAPVPPLKKCVSAIVETLEGVGL